MDWEHTEQHCWQQTRLLGRAFKQRHQSATRQLGHANFLLHGFGGFQELEMLLRNVRLQGDPAIKVYEKASIVLKRAHIANLSPLSLYALRGQLAQHAKLFWNLQAIHQNLFDLVGTLDYSIGKSAYRMVPPIIETYREPTSGTRVSGIIDGLHRICLARAMGLEAVWIVAISRVPADLPPIALPATWNEVVLCDVVPSSNAKRHYRYTHPADAPSTASGRITAENYAYFLYRDFSSLGSSGVRRSGDSGSAAT